MKLRDLLGMLRDAYCRTIGIEYMHIQDPSSALDPGASRGRRRQAHAATSRCASSRSTPPRRSRPSCRPSTSARSASPRGRRVGDPDARRGPRGRRRGRLDEVGASACRTAAGSTCSPTSPARATTRSSASSRARHSRPEVGQGSGDVKYHLGHRGHLHRRVRPTIEVYLAANPSPPRGRQPGRRGHGARQAGPTSTSPRTFTGAADAHARRRRVRRPGRGGRDPQPVASCAGYRTGGTIHIIVNNQVGFTTSPSRPLVGVLHRRRQDDQAPIFHVNGDDPEACVRVARLAFEFRQAFHKDVVIDMVCYRRRGHNEGDDPSLTQPLMYKPHRRQARSVRKLYTESLVGAATSRSRRPSRRCATTRPGSSGRSTRDPRAKPPRGPTPSRCRHAVGVLPHVDTGVERETLDRDLRRPVDGCPRASPSTPSWPSSSRRRAKMVETARSTGPRRGARHRLAAARGQRDIRLAGQDSGAAPSPSATPCSSTTRPAPRSATPRCPPGPDGTRASSGSTTRCSASTRPWASSTATRW
jgi:2-oxoglutarate decarboxylase